MSTENKDLSYSLTLETFSQEIVCGLRSRHEPIIDAYADYIKENSPENPRSIEEYCIEFIMLGVFWRSYTALADSVSDKDLNRLILLSNPQYQKGLFKSINQKQKKQLIERIVTAKPSGRTSLRHPALDEFEHLLLWLTAIGEYDQEVRRLLNWRDHFMKLTEREALEVIGSAIRFADVFNRECRLALPPVEFTNAKKNRIMVQFLPGQAEYYLNAIGVAVINAANRETFLSKPRKAILLPASLCAREAVYCRSKPSGLGYQCDSCTGTCQASSVFELGIRHQIEVYLVRDGSSLFKDSIVRGNTKEDLGVLAIAPLSEQISTTWKLKALDIAPQCLFLSPPSPHIAPESSVPVFTGELLRLLDFEE